MRKDRALRAPSSRSVSRRWRWLAGLAAMMLAGCGPAHAVRSLEESDYRLSGSGAMGVSSDGAMSELVEAGQAGIEAVLPEAQREADAGGPSRLYRGALLGCLYCLYHMPDAATEATLWVQQVKDGEGLTRSTRSDLELRLVAGLLDSEDAEVRGLALYVLAEKIGDIRSGEAVLRHLEAMVRDFPFPSTDLSRRSELNTAFMRFRRWTYSQADLMPALDQRKGSDYERFEQGSMAVFKASREEAEATAAAARAWLESVRDKLPAQVLAASAGG